MRSHIWKISATVMKREKAGTIGMTVAIAGAVLAALIPPLVLERMVNALSNHKEITFVIAFFYLIMFIISNVLESLQNVMITRMGQKITHELRSAMNRKLTRLPAAYFVENETGKITSRFVNDVDAVDALFTNGIISMFADALKVLSIFTVIFVKSRGLGLLLCITTPSLLLMTLAFQKRMRAAQIRNREAVAKVNHHVPETIQNIRMIHVFQSEQYMEEKYDTYIQEGFDAIEKSNFYDSIYSPIIIWVSAWLVAVMMVCASMGNEFQSFFGITVGSAVAMIAYVGKVFDPLESLGMELQNIQGALAGISRIDEFMDEVERPCESMLEQDSKQEKQILIKFDDVSFHYEDGKEVLRNLNFSISRGEHIVFTGRTGAGKSTMFKLLLGLYAPVSGTVTVQGENPQTMGDTVRRHTFGYVEQHFAIVEGDICNQIRLFDEQITDTDVWNALKQCGLKDKIEHLPDNMHRQMNPADFSQGELQLLSIARALVCRPDILLLDEMTANLDSVTEQHILRIIKQLGENQTVISISHRMSEELEDVRIISI